MLLICLLGSMLLGCNSTPRRDPMFAPSYPAPRPSPMPAQVTTGAIYQPGYDVVLFEDARARRIGDILTVRLVENTNAQKSSSTDITRDQNSSVSNPTLLGATPQFDLPSVAPLGSTEDNNLQTSIESNHEFEGSSAAQQRNSLSGDITVTVADVLPNGYLMVRGEKRLNLNQGNEYVKIAGIVRPIDILPDNSVPSTKIADATIVYNGDGATADANKIGWLARFFVSALFPF